jgi:hypothetical protein
MKASLNLMPLLLLGLLACVPATTIPLASVDCGPRPSEEEAHAYVGVISEQILWGPRTEIQAVKVGEKARWRAHLTGRWPRGKDTGPFLEGWLLTFQAKPSQGLNPNQRFQRLEALVDKDKVVHWHAQRDWDRPEDILPKIDRIQPTPPPAPTTSGPFNPRG